MIIHTMYIILHRYHKKLLTVKLNKIIMTEHTYRTSSIIIIIMVHQVSFITPIIITDLILPVENNNNDYISYILSCIIVYLTCIIIQEASVRHDMTAHHLL